MMSSLASLFVAKAKATPENVVPCENALSERCSSTRERGGTGTNKVDSDNQLGFAPAVALDLGSRLAAIGGGAGALLLLRRRRGVAGGASIAGRPSLDGRRAAHDGWRVSGGRAAGVDGRRTTDHLRGRGPGLALVERTGAANGAGRGAGRIVCRVAGRSGTGTWVVHWEALLRRRGGDRRRWAGAGGEQRRELRGARGRRGPRLGQVGTLDAGGRFSFTEAKAFEAVVERDRAH